MKLATLGYMGPANHSWPIGLPFDLESSKRIPPPSDAVSLGGGYVRLAACTFRNRWAPFALDAAVFNGFLKRMSQRKRGGQPGNRNAWKTGRHSAERRAALEAELAERFRRQREWMASRPKTDYAAICEAIRADADRLKTRH